MICPYCKEGILELVPADEPWHEEYYICPKCDSTYSKKNDALSIITYYES